ncbi:hypothetical protein HNR00_003948 [Methylorubrum rhodinum]|uniref:DUF6883 domain-containing protein n=1 Tax=Methylorubrum rhodinum TaxID=29428 RepID=A0A840ZNL2_9HYPH|nr:DUF6883 domain-containing protein [Methylorubrum rhodinum]MBB5759216.1 hypothetical protein [Methylorubrum rhodinum]
MIEPNPIPAQYRVEDAKIRAYFLDPDHGEGGAKCAFLVSVGFSTDDPEALKQALLLHPTLGDLTRSVVLPFGRRLHFDAPLPCPGGASANVRTVWQVDRDAAAGIARFITLKPLPKLPPTK